MTEARGDRNRFGEQRLRESVEGAADPRAAVAAVESALDSFIAGEPEDDAAVLAIMRSRAPQRGFGPVGPDGARIAAVGSEQGVVSATGKKGIAITEAGRTFTVESPGIEAWITLAWNRERTSARRQSSGWCCRRLPPMSRSFARRLGGALGILGLGETRLLDINAAVSEACNNVVVHAYPDSDGPMDVRLWIGQTGLEVIVSDNGVGIRPNQPSPQLELQGLGLSLIQTLTEWVEFLGGAGDGNEGPNGLQPGRRPIGARGP